MDVSFDSEFSELKQNLSDGRVEIILLGEENVGKTQIINQLIPGNFDEYHKIYSPKENYTTIKIEEDNNIKSKDLLIFDFPSIKNFSSINKNFMRTCNIILLVYDMTNIESFFFFFSWNKLIIEKDNLIKCVVANKKDLLEKRLISEEEGKKYASEIGALYFETNAKNNKEINQLFKKIVKIYSDLDLKTSTNIKHLKSEKRINKRKKKGKCCQGIGFSGFSGLSFIDESPISYMIKQVNFKEEKNDNSKDEGNNLENSELIIGRISGIKIIIGEKKEDVVVFNNETIFKGTLNNGYFDTGKLSIENLQVNIYNGKIVNLINVLLFVNNSKILEKEIDFKGNEEKYYELENNCVLKVKCVEMLNNFIFNEVILKEENLILFIIDNFEKAFIDNIKQLCDKICKINNEGMKIGIISYKNVSDNKVFEDLTKSYDIFYEEIDSEIHIEYFLNNIKNKYLNHLENKVFKEQDGTYFGDSENGKKEGFGIKLYSKEKIYCGKWKNDVQEGEGVEIIINNLPELVKYIGEWKNNEFISGEKDSILGKIKINKNRKRKYNFLDLLEFEGEMDNDNFLFGRLKIKNGIIYEGKFENEVISSDKEYKTFKKGEGTIIYPNCDIYKEKWNQFRKNGKGIIYTRVEEIKIEAEWENDILINNNVQIEFKNGDIFIGEICNEEEKEKEEEKENFDSNFDLNIKKYNFEEQLDFIQKILPIIETESSDFEEYDEEIGNVEFDIEYINNLWKVGTLIREKKDKYIEKAKKYLFFKDYYKKFCALDELFKTKIVNIINELCQKFLCFKRYNILYGNITLLFDDKQDISVIDKNFLKFYEIRYFNGILDKNGINLNKILKRIKGIMKYNNGDIYI